MTPSPRRSTPVVASAVTAPAASKARAAPTAARAPAAVLALTVATALSACASVQPWERGTLARPEMQLDANALQTGLYEQVYDSKEASSGGGGTAGAGCGCN